jgi:hypothetical protein
MVKKIEIVIASVAGAIVATYVLSGNMNIGNLGAEGSGNSVQQW